jgi:hypothetical protein
MASASQVQPNFTFVKGIITEASPLTYPENATIDEENFELDVSGRRSRRLGIDFELNYQYISIGYSYTNPLTNYAFQTFRWDNVGNNPTIAIIVVQAGSFLYFFDAFKDSQTPNEITKTGYVYVDETIPTSFTIVDGDLVISGATNSAFAIAKYNEASEIISFTEYNELLVRDLWGVDDGYAIDERPTELSSAHEYNLKNQGWTPTRCEINGFVAKNPVDPIQATFDDDSYGRYPSNADIMRLFRGASGSDADVYRADFLRDSLLGNTPAPKGRNVIDLLTLTATTSTVGSASARPEADTYTGKATVCGSYAGRLWLAGLESTSSGSSIKAPSINSMILFSRLIKNEDDLNKFYQEADPTSDEINELIATDGGFIIIPEATGIQRLEAISQSLLVFAENGVWEVRGGESGFNATDYQVNKITNIGSMSRMAIVNAESSIFYFAKSGIYVIEPDQTQTLYKATNITENTVQTLYLGIPSASRAKAVGVFEPEYRKIRWLYQSDSAETKYVYNRELILDLQLGAFSKYKYTTPTASSPQICGIYTTPNFTTLTGEAIVTDSTGATVTDSLGASVTVPTTARQDSASAVKYLTIEVPTTGLWQMTVAARSNTEFKDWATFGDNVDAPAYMVTGYNISGDSMRYKQVPYVTFHFNRTETGFDTLLAPRNPSSCLVTPYWDFADSSTSGKIGTQFEAYRLNRNYIPSGSGDSFNYGQSVISTKSKLRGRGRALSLRMDTQSGYDCQMYGWSLVMTGNTVV